MYEFIDVNEVSEESILPSEALMINGDYIENLIEGYRTLQVIGREALSVELKKYESAARDGSVIQNRRYPARYITVKFQLITKSSEDFRKAFNRLASILSVEDAELIFNDEPDKFFIGTPETIEEIPGGRNAVVGSFTICCADPFKYSVQEYVASPEPGQNTFLIDYNGTYKAYPTLEAEFYNENEAIAALTGAGDCGYVAFFNDKKKIIQMGDPDEPFGITHEKSQTLVSQQFNDGNSWNNVTERNWRTDIEEAVSKNEVLQSGGMQIKPATYYTTNNFQLLGVLKRATSSIGKPDIEFEVTSKVETLKRTKNSVSVDLTIISSLIATVQTNQTSKNVSKGAKVTLNKTKLYASSSASSASGTKTGTYYLWDSSVVKGRIRITNSSSNVGKSGQVTGWVNLSDIGFSSTASSGSTATTVSLGKGIILKAYIQFMGGDWHSVILKPETAIWVGNGARLTSLTVEVNDIEDSTVLLENIKFKVEKIERTYEGDNVKEETTTILEEIDCDDLEINAYAEPVVKKWYLMPEAYGTNEGWHGPFITRTIPTDTAGEYAKNFTFTYCNEMSIGASSMAIHEKGLFEALIVSNDEGTRKIIAGVNIVKGSTGTDATLSFIINNNVVHTATINLERFYTSSIIKDGKNVKFNVHGIEKTFANTSIANTEAKEITFVFAKLGLDPELAKNGLEWAKFVKNNCDTYTDIPNKFSANDIVQANCKTGEIFLNDISTPSLGALGNDWETFYLSPGMNQIGCSYSDWVLSSFAPNFKIKYREVFI